MHTQEPLIVELFMSSAIFIMGLLTIVGTVLKITGHIIRFIATIVCIIIDISCRVKMLITHRRINSIKHHVN